jgi:pentose-5-phosphate-3-epimerase
MQHPTLTRPVLGKAISCRNICINPSILSVNFVNLEAKLQRIGNADAVHVDVMNPTSSPTSRLGYR